VVRPERLVWRFVNVYRGWCRRRGLRPSRALARARREIQGQLGWLHQLHEGGLTRRGGRRYGWLLLTDRVGDDFLHWRPKRARAKRARGIRLALPRGLPADAHGRRGTWRVVEVGLVGTRMIADALVVRGTCGDEILSTWGRGAPRRWFSLVSLSEEMVWRNLLSVPFTPEERRAVQTVVRALVVAQHLRWTPCRMCRVRGRTLGGVGWVVQRGRMVDCVRCQGDAPPWTRSRRAARAGARDGRGHSHSPTDERMGKEETPGS